MAIDQALLNYLIALTAVPIQGRILNVGLGQGFTARLMLDKRLVSEVVTVEIDPEVIAAYEAKYDDALEDFHTIVPGDARTVQLEGVFTVAFVDILSQGTQAEYDGLKAVAQNLGPHLTDKSAIVFEWAADTTAERSMRRWLEDNLVRHVARPALSPVGRGMAAAVEYWTKA